MRTTTGAERRARRTLAVAAVVAAAAALAACGASTGPGSYVGEPSVRAVAGQLSDEGRDAYYLGPEAAGLALTDLTRVTENGPEFQVWASYGSCHPAAFEEGGCMDPLSVSTRDWRPDVTGVSCTRLEPQLGVPAGLVMGELTLFTSRVQVAVVHVDDLTDLDGHRGLALLKDLRVIGASEPVGSLPPPDPEIAAWVDGLCGAVPGASVEHPIEEPSSTLDNVHVPDFTVDLLGGGRFTWSQRTPGPLVLAVGDVDEVSGALRRLAPLVTASPSHPTLLGLVAELDRAKGSPRPIGQVEQDAGRLPAPVGYAAADLSPAVWFLDSAANLGQGGREWGRGVVAFVDATGVVRSYAPVTAPAADLRAAADALT
jgi:hypothetical protein